MRTLFLVLALAGLGAAHSDLASSTPADGDVVSALPAEVRLNFTEPVEVRFSTFKVYPLEADLGPDAPDAEARLNGLAGALVSEVLEAQGDEDARADTSVRTGERTAETVTLPFKEGLGAGVYVVMWRALSVDTHTKQGFLTFRVAP